MAELSCSPNRRSRPVSTTQFKFAGSIRASSIGRDSTFTSSNRQFDTCILGRETIKPQTRHTLYKLEVDGGVKKWVIYRRYRDFVLLNKKLKRLFPNFLLTLPPKRIIRDNFDKDFVEKRQDGLDEFVKNILNHAEISRSEPVIRFFRLENPPEPHESLDASQQYCDDLERTVVELKYRCRELEDEICTLQNDLASSHHNQQEFKGLMSHYEAQYSHQGTQLQDLNQQVATAKCNELKAKEELDKVHEEIKAERACVKAAIDIEKNKQESNLEEQWERYYKHTEETNNQLSSLVTSFGELSDFDIKFAGKSFQFKATEAMTDHANELKKAIESMKKQQEIIYKDMVKMYSNEIQNLKAELARNDLITQTRIQEAETLRTEMREIQTRCYNDVALRDNMIIDLQRQLSLANQNSNGTEQKYFYSLVLGVKLNMAICGFTMDEINQMKPQNLYSRVKANNIDSDNWPSWVSRELACTS